MSDVYGSNGSKINFSYLLESYGYYTGTTYVDSALVARSVTNTSERPSMALELFPLVEQSDEVFTCRRDFRFSGKYSIIKERT